MNLRPRNTPMFGRRVVDNISEWVSGGGTIIGISGAVSFLASEEADLLAVAPESLVRAGKDFHNGQRNRSVAPRHGRLLAADADFRKAIEAVEEPTDSLPVAILQARLDPEQWLCAGLKETVDVMSQGTPVFSPIKLDKGVNAAIFPDSESGSGLGVLVEGEPGATGAQAFGHSPAAGPGTCNRLHRRSELPRPQ